MKRIAIIVIICTFAGLAFSQNFGIGVTNPSEKLDVDGNIHLQNITSGRRDVRGQMGDNDYWSIGGHPTGSNSGVLEIATGDDGQSAGGAEPIVVRQYGPGTPWSGTLVRTAYLLDASGNTSFPGDTRFGCRSGFWAVGDGRLCMQNSLRGPNTMHNAIADCQNQGPGSRVCEHNDMRQACGAGFNPYGGQSAGWYGDHGVASGGNWDDEFGTWNRGDCDDPNNDGPAQTATAASYYYRCCY